MKNNIRQIDSKKSAMKFLGSFKVFSAIVVIFMTLPWAYAGNLLDELKVTDTCGTVYADKLASCSPFQCQKPSPMAMMFGFPSEDELNKMPLDKQKKMRAAMIAAEKKMATMPPKKLAEMKAKMVSFLKIKGFDRQGSCQTTTIAIPGQQLDCSFDKNILSKVVNYTRVAATADHIQVKSSSHLVNGKMVTKQIDTIDGKEMSNPWQQAIEKGQCKLIETAQHAKSSSQVANKQKTKKTSLTKQKANTLFILDASGSMWGQIKGKAKITIAKEVMAKLVPELSNDSRIGLIAYGHRRKGDCNDVETLVTLGDNHKQSVLDAVKGLSAKGKTPLTLSVNQAFKQLRSEKNISTVVLVSDGIESCGGDPCAAVKAAKASGMNFILHTVGFGLSKDETKQLQCMAKAGDGEFFQANNAEELLKSTRKATKALTLGALKLTLTSNGKPVNAWVKLVGKGSIGLADLTNDRGVKPGHLWHLKPGVYQLETLPAGLQGVSPLIVKNIVVESGKTVEKQLGFDQSLLRIKATNNGLPAIVQIKVIDRKSGRPVFDTATFSTFTMRGVKTPYEIKLIPGKYRLDVKLPTKSALAPYQEDIDLTSPGMSVDKSVNIKTSILRITAIKKGKPVKARIYIDDLKTKKDIFNSDFLVSFGFQTPYEVTLLPGKYRLTVNQTDIDSRHIEEIEINSNEKVLQRTIHFDVNTIAVKDKDMKMEMELDTDRPGNDYRQFNPTSADPTLCLKACQQDAQCKAWTYVKPNIQGPQPHCYLKSPIPASRHNTCCVSGIKK